MRLVLQHNKACSLRSCVSMCGGWLTTLSMFVQDFDASDSDSDRSDSVTDSAFIYKAQAAQKFAAGGQGGPEFDRISQRLEKDLGLGNDMDSLMSVERGGADFAQVKGPNSRTHVNL